MIDTLVFGTKPNTKMVNNSLRTSSIAGRTRRGSFTPSGSIYERLGTRYSTSSRFTKTSSFFGMGSSRNKKVRQLLSEISAGVSFTKNGRVSRRRATNLSTLKRTDWTGLANGQAHSLSVVSNRHSNAISRQNSWSTFKSKWRKKAFESLILRAMRRDLNDYGPLSGSLMAAEL